MAIRYSILLLFKIINALISGYLGLPKLMGTVPSDLKTFDAEFFDFNDPEEVNALDFQLRFLIEKAYEAFLDAGIISLLL
jgi:hypothetical protein